jgi:Type I phosphodiesterase / nucleotide pyrophosphatase
MIMKNLLRFRLFRAFGVGAIFISFWVILPTLAWATTNHVLLFVLEGVDSKVIEAKEMPVLKKLANEGAARLEAQSISPPLTVSSMATLLTGLPVVQHRVNADWETYDFSRSFLRSPTMFDYLDLAGGVDTALFIMDERFYQLSRPEIYVDLQTCGKSKPQCNPGTVVGHIDDYLTKVVSKGGYGFRLFEVPGLLVMHLPAPMDAALKRGWDSPAYTKALSATDKAIGDVMGLYRRHKVLDKTMVIVTGLNGQGIASTGHENGSNGKSHLGNSVPWIAWGANVKPGHRINASVSIMDTGATVMEALGLETHTEWQSKSLNEIFIKTPERKTTGNENFER